MALEEAKADGWILVTEGRRFASMEKCHDVRVL